LDTSGSTVVIIPVVIIPTVTVPAFIVLAALRTSAYKSPVDVDVVDHRQSVAELMVMLWILLPSGIGGNAVPPAAIWAAGARLRCP